MLSAAMLLRFSLDAPEAANDIERAVAAVLLQGFRTADIAERQSSATVVGTQAMGDAVIAALSD